MDIKTLNEKLKKVLNEIELKATNKPAFSKTQKFNSQKELDKAIEEVKEYGYILTKEEDNGVPIITITNKNDEHVGTFNLDTKEFFHEDHDPKFNYMMLDRLRQDCLYFIEHPVEKHLWAGNIDDQVAEMKRIWNELEEKPEWISLEEIDNLEKQMKQAFEEK